MRIDELKGMAVQFGRAVRFMLASLTDEQACSVAGMFEAWSAGGVSYSQGDRVTYDGGLYRCLQTHVSQESWTPTAAPSLWTAISDPQDEYPLWIQPTGAHDAYSQGDKVTHDGKKYVSNVDGNVWEPPTQWTEVTI